MQPPSPPEQSSEQSVSATSQAQPRIVASFLSGVLAEQNATASPKNQDQSTSPSQTSSARTAVSKDGSPADGSTPIQPPTVSVSGGQIELPAPPTALPIPGLQAELCVPTAAVVLNGGVLSPQPNQTSVNGAGNSPDWSADPGVRTASWNTPQSLSPGSNDEISAQLATAFASPVIPSNLGTAQGQAPQIQLSQLQVPQLQVPQIQVPQIQPPPVQSPDSQAPQVQVVQTQLSPIQVPQIQAQIQAQVQAPQMQSPASQGPPATLPASSAPALAGDKPAAHVVQNFLAALRTVVTDAPARYAEQLRQSQPLSAALALTPRISNLSSGFSSVTPSSFAESGKLFSAKTTVGKNDNHAAAGGDSANPASTSSSQGWAQSSGQSSGQIPTQASAANRDLANRDAQSSKSVPDASDASAQKNSAAVVAQAAALPAASPLPATVTPADSVMPATAAVPAPAAARSQPDPSHPPGDPGSPSNPSPAADLPAAAATSPVQMAQMVSKAATSEMRIGMSTTAFGSVEVRTVVHANDVGVLIGSEKGDLRALLANELPGIANSLQQQNLRLNQVNFHGFSFSNQTSSGSDGQARSFNPRSNRYPGTPGEMGSGESGEPGEVSTASPRTGLSILA